MNESAFNARYPIYIDAKKFANRFFKTLIFILLLSLQSNGQSHLRLDIIQAFTFLFIIKVYIFLSTINY